MPTVTLRVKEDSMQKLYKLLDQLPDVEVIENESSFDATKAHLNESLQNIGTGKNGIVSQLDLEKKLADILKKHEG
jgi:hypothetical protein